MLWLGLLSVVQVAFLPGYLALRAARLTDGLGRTLVLSFALSLVLNHFLVIGLVLGGWYRPGVLYGLFAAELVLLAWTARRWPRLTLAEVLPSVRWQGGRSLLAAAAWMLMAGFAAYSLYRAGDIFQEWDAVVSWNRWAIDWAANRLPRTTAEYPQLLPCNLSLSYVFIQQSTIWFFAKGWLFLFPLLLLTAMFDLGRQSGGAGHFLGLFVTYALLIAVLRFRYLSSGYADMPVAFMAYSGVYALLLARRTTDAGRQAKYVLLGAVFCAGAALTKQAGLLIAAVYPLLVWLVVYRPAGGRSADGPARCNGRAWYTQIILPMLVLVALIAPWYVYKQIAIYYQADHGLTAHLIGDMHTGRSLAQRLLHAGELLREAMGLPAAAALLLAMGWALKDPVERWLVALVVFPFTLIWALGFSYELRNLALAVPLAGMAAGVGGAELIGKLWGRAEALTLTLSRRERGPLPTLSGHRPKVGWERGLLSLRLGYLLVPLAVPLVLWGMMIGRDDLANRQRALQRAVGRRDVNAMLYAATDEYDRDRRPAAAVAIATDYLPLQWAPGLERHFVACGSESLASFRAVYQRPEIGFALVHQEHTAPEVWQYLAAAEARGSSRLVSSAGHYCLYQKSERR